MFGRDQLLPGYPSRRPRLPSALVGGDPPPIWAANCGSPVIQPFPTTIAALNDAIGFTANAEAIYLHSGLGTGFTDSLGNHNLSRIAGTGYFQQDAVGLTPSRQCMEFSSDSDEWQIASTSAFDLNSGSVAGLLVWRTRATHFDGQGFWAKWASGGHGWYLSQNAANAVQIYAVNAVSTSQGIAVARDDAWHCLVFSIQEDDNLKLVIDGSFASAPISGAYNAQADPLTFGAQTGNENAGRAQVAFSALWAGAAADTVHANIEDIQENFWLHGSDPTGKLDKTIFVLSSLPSTRFAADKIASWSGFGSQEQFPMAYDEADGSLGLLSANDQSPKIARSDQFEDAVWTPTNITVGSGTLYNSPRGFREARTLTADAAGGFIDADIDTPASSTEYAFAVWIRLQSGGGGGSIKIREDGSSDAGSQSITVTSTWQRFVIVATTGTITTAQARIEMDTSGSVWEVASASCFEGQDRRVVEVRTIGALIPTDTLYDLMRSVETWDPAVELDLGAIVWEGTLLMEIDGTNQGIAALSRASPGGSPNSRIIGGGSPNTIRAASFDSVSAVLGFFAAGAAVAGDEYKLSLDWHVTAADLDGSQSHNYYKGASKEDMTATTGTVSADTVYMHILGGPVPSQTIGWAMITKRLRLFDLETKGLL